MFRMVLVDDEPMALAGMEDIIDWERAGFQICGRCGSGEEALQLIRELRPDAVVTDIRLPEMSGVDLIRQTREDGLETEFVIVSAYGDFEIARAAILLGAVHYLLKPLNPAEVTEAARLLAERLSGKSGRMPPVREPFVLNPETPSLAGLSWTPAAPDGGCYLAYSNRPFVPPLPPEQFYPLRVGGNHGSLLCGEEEPRLPETVGLSCRHRGFSSIGLMLEEARVSFHGGFRYVDHETAASIQLYLGQHYKEELQLKDLAVKFFLSETYLCDLFKKNTGETILNFLRQLRIHRAMGLLTGTSMTLRQVAEESGYADYSYFGRHFKCVTGMTPDLYRKEKR